MTFGKLLHAAPVFGALVLAACGGGDGAAPASGAATHGQGFAVGEPSPNAKAPVVADFVAAHQRADCAGVRNNLYVIDNRQVLWERQGDCPDNAAEQVLYGATTDEVLCRVSSGFAGPRVSCKDEAARTLFDSLINNLEQPNLGLAATRRVEKIALGGRAPVAFAPLVLDVYAGLSVAQNLVIKDAASFRQLWDTMYSKRQPAPELPAVDFSSKMVVGVFAGEQPHGCRTLAIVKTERKDAALEVAYRLHDLQTFAICTAAISTPAALAVVDRTDAAVEFVNLASEPSKQSAAL